MYSPNKLKTLIKIANPRSLSAIMVLPVAGLLMTLLLKIGDNAANPFRWGMCASVVFICWVIAHWSIGAYCGTNTREFVRRCSWQVLFALAFIGVMGVLDSSGSEKVWAAVIFSLGFLAGIWLIKKLDNERQSNPDPITVNISNN